MFGSCARRPRGTTESRDGLGNMSDKLADACICAVCRKISEIDPQIGAAI